MHQLERVTNLLTLLLSARRHITFEEIRHELRGQYPDGKEAARAAFERDKAVLRDEGVPIDQVTLSGQQAGQTGYRVLRSAYEMEDFGLTPEETAALRVAVGTIRLGTNWKQGLRINFLHLQDKFIGGCFSSIVIVNCSLFFPLNIGLGLEYLRC